MRIYPEGNDKEQKNINTPFKWLQQKIVASPNLGQDVEKLNHLYIAGENAK